MPLSSTLSSNRLAVPEPQCESQTLVCSGRRPENKQQCSFTVSIGKPPALIVRCLVKFSWCLEGPKPKWDA